MKIYGKTVDSLGRCVHYQSEMDTISIKFKCCEKFYACIYCHQEAENHVVELWPKSEFDKNAIFCGKCNHLMPIAYYLENESCSKCNALFNSACENHFHMYFDIP